MTAPDVERVLLHEHQIAKDYLHEWFRNHPNNTKPIYTQTETKHMDALIITLTPSCRKFLPFIEIKYVQGKGYGVFAKQCCLTLKQRFGVYTGMFATYVDTDSKSDYIFEFSKKKVVDGKAGVRIYSLVRPVKSLFHL